MFFNNKKVILISLISLFIFSCDDDDNPVGPIDDIENYVYPIQLIIIGYMIVNIYYLILLVKWIH